METLSIPAGMTEKEYFETVASEADFLKWYKEQDLPTYETPSVTADMVAYCFVQALSYSPQSPPLSTPPRLGGGLCEQG